jgi:flagellar hook-length control protein FliK
VVSPPAQASGPATSALATLSVNNPLAQGDWDQALGERIQWMVNRKMQGAQIRLNPAQLGPMEVRIQVQNDQASIQFSSAHSMVREALEAALPRLRDMFDASGVELVDVDVSGQSSAGEQRAGGEDGAVARGAGVIDGDSGAETVLETPVSALLENAGIDLFA